MNADEREEIAASVAAHAELGPRYESAVAEGLVERIGEEIDRRVDARLRSLGHQGNVGHQPSAGNLGSVSVGGAGQQNVPRQAYLSPGHQIVPPGYQGGQQPAQQPGAAQAQSSPPPPAAPASRGSGVTGLLLGLGSMGIGLGATAVVVIHHVSTVAALFMVILIWLAIMGINIAHSQRR